MKIFLFAFVSLFVTSVFAFEDYKFSCDLGNLKITSQAGVKKAPESPVVGLNIKVLNEQVPLFLIKATTSNGNLDLFATDWEPKAKLSQEGLDLLDLLGLFFDIDGASVTHLRAGIPTDLLNTFAYLEVKEKSGKVTKLGFEGVNPTVCK